MLAAPPGAPLSERAAAVALDVLLQAARRGAIGGVRTTVKDGLACTLVVTTGRAASRALASPRWTVWTPGRMAVFHRPGTVAKVPPHPPDRQEDDIARVVIGGRQ